MYEVEEQVVLQRQLTIPIGEIRTEIKLSRNVSQEKMALISGIMTDATELIEKVLESRI